MSEFEVCFNMYGTATVKASSMDEAVEIASQELNGWNGGAVDLEMVSVDGAGVGP